jgi:hypothetical protein
MGDILLLDHEEDRPKNDFRLMRLCEWAGYDLKIFKRKTITASSPTPWEGLNDPPSVTVTLGPRAALAAGLKRSLNEVRGYVWDLDSRRVIPTVGVGYIQRGNSRWSAAFINDIQKAVQLAYFGMPPQVTSYCLDPTPLGALQWADQYIRYLQSNPLAYLAFDIETPGKGDDEESADTDPSAPDRTWKIERIGFSYAGLSALSIPWEPSYFAAIRLLLGSSGDKVVWNHGFDVPRIRRAGVQINGTIHDGMVAWHILHSDLPKRLGFVATFTCPWQPAWKHLSGARPAYYNATDADVELRSMLVIEQELKNSGLWDVYQRDVLDLEPILVHMHQKGMPIDESVRADRAVKLSALQAESRRTMESLVPLDARRIAIVYKNVPKCTDGLLSRGANRMVPRCSVCGCSKPRKDHFKVFKKKSNPCSAGVVVNVEEPALEYYRLADFTPSREQLIRYHAHLNRKNPTKWDKKARKYRISFDEESLKKLILDYPQDLLYPEILNYRSLDKLAGTYIGRPVD